MSQPSGHLMLRMRQREQKWNLSKQFGLVGPGFTVIEKCTENACLVHSELCVDSQLVVGPHSLTQSGHQTGSFDVLLVSVQKQVFADDGAKVNEVIGDFKEFIVDGDVGRCRNILTHDILFHSISPLNLKIVQP